MRFSKHIIKSALILCGLLTLVSTKTLSASITLNAGQAVEGTFSGFTPTGNVYIPNGIPDVFVGVHFDDTLLASDVVQLEMFSDNLQQAPMFTVQWVGTGDTAVPGTNFGYMNLGGHDYWPDFQGAYRITILSGSATLNGISIQDVDNLIEYTTTIQDFNNPISIPEPSTLVLLLVGVVLNIRNGGRH